MDRSVVALMDAARRAGVEVRHGRDGLLVRGPEAARPVMVELRERSAEVLAMLAERDPEVAWRAAAMREQVAAGVGLVPLLVTSGGRLAESGCLSCGCSLDSGCAWRCLSCLMAARVIVMELEARRRDS